jgi:septal ring factor EnvC (AmiA/AmiB activator)
VSSTLVTAIGAVLVALVAAAASIYTARDARRAKRLDVEGGAYQRAREIDEGIVADLRGEIDRLKAGQKEMRDELRETRASAATLQRQNAVLRRLVIQHVPGVNFADFITEEDR